MTAVLFESKPQATNPDAPPRFGPLDNGRLMTPEEFDAISFEDVDDCYHYELIRGVLVVTELVHPTESAANDELSYLVRSYAIQREMPVKTTYNAYVHTETCRRRADRAIWIGIGRAIEAHQDVPAIAIEFLSAGTRSRQRDYEEKRQEYLDLGIQEFWLFDRFQKQLTVFHRRGGSDQEQVIAMTEIYRTPLLPGFELSVGQILSRAEDWEQGA